MTERFETVLQRYGRAVQLCAGAETTQTRAFLQPVTETDKTAPFQVTTLGTADDRQWIYLGKTALAEGTLVRADGACYRAQSVRAIYAGAELSHYWALLIPEREAAE